jgi:hypothetical protein
MYPKREDIAYAHLATYSTPRRPSYQCPSCKQQYGPGPTFLLFFNLSPWSLSQSSIHWVISSFTEVRFRTYLGHQWLMTNRLPSQPPPSHSETRPKSAASTIDSSVSTCHVMKKMVGAIVDSCRAVEEAGGVDDGSEKED